MSAPVGTAGSDVWTVRRVLDFAIADFRSRGIDSPRLDAELLLAHVLGVTRVQLIVDALRPLSPDELQAYREAIVRRRRREPVAYILGEREFYGLSFRVDARVLVPRPDTETLVDVALERTRTESLSGRALDLCTGSGCVAIAFWKQRPTWRVTATDVSPDAVAVARLNVERLGAAFGVHVVEGDLDAPIAADERFDLIVSNPPYVADPELTTLQPEIREHEPRVALSGGKDGLDSYRRIAPLAARRLAPGGVVALEVGAGQAGDVARLLAEHGIGGIEPKRDLGGIERVVSGRLD
jgi:release factor glutamine methyltransferase